MSANGSPVIEFLARLPEKLRADVGPDLETALEALFANARRAWPNVEVSRAGVYAYVAEKIDEAAPSFETSSFEAMIERIHTNDLYLAFACLSGSPEALSAFDEHCAADVAAVLRRNGRGLLTVDDVHQMLREHLFVAPAKIRNYTGRSSLRAWCRVVVTRLVLNAVTRGPRELPAAEDDAALLDDVADDAGLELGHMKTLYASELRVVFPLAFGRLSVQERLVLRQRYLDGLTNDEIGTLHGVHRATVKRQLARAREVLATSIRELLKARLRVTDTELESILRLIQSEFYITMQRFL